MHEQGAEMRLVLFYVSSKFCTISHVIFAWLAQVVAIRGGPTPHVSGIGGGPTPNP